MLGKLFGFMKNNNKDKGNGDKKPGTPAVKSDAVSGEMKSTTSPDTASNPPAPKNREPSLLEQLTHGQPIDAITDQVLLHQLVKQSQKLDKKTNRLVRERLNALKEQEKQQQQLHEKQEKICVRLETLSRLQHHPLYDSEFAHLQQQWQTLADPDADLAKRILAATEKCHAVQQEAAALKQHELQLQEQAARESEEKILQQAERDRLLDEQKASELATMEQQKNVQQEKQKQSQEDREKHEKKQKETCQTLTQQLIQLEQAIDNADSKKARELHDRVRDTLKKLDQKRQHDFDGKFHLLSGQLRDLQDWQSFAAMPKLEALCEAMEKLINVELQPLQKADSVRELQNQWRAMKPPTSKQAQALWDRFKQASDRAWEPCAAHFEKEKQLRAFNLQQRLTICEALEQFFSAQNWDKADWKGVARIIDKAKKEFHDYHPVERNEEKNIRTRFDAALSAINAQLLEEQKANENRKRQLVEAATSIATMEDCDKAIDRVRDLQEQWKLIGLTRRHEDQKLWQALQDQTTIIFNKRRANQQQQRQTENDQTNLARTLCEQIAALAQLPDAELSQSGSEFERLQGEYKTATATLHEKAQQALKKTFYAACDNYRQQLAGIAHRQHNQQLQELARRAALCAALESGTADHDTVEAQWVQGSLTPDWERAIEQRRQRANQPPDHAANEQQLRELCIALEVLLDMETPTEDRPLRRELQLRKLQQGLGQGSSNRNEQLEQLLVQWYCSSTAAPAIQATLQARFDAVQKLAGKRPV